jgi:hypothetical protein
MTAECASHTGHEARIKRNEENDNIIFNELRAKISSKIFYFAMAIISACLTGLLGIYIGMSNHINELSIATMASLNKVETNQAVMSTNLNYIAEQVKKNGGKY